MKLKVVVSDKTLSESFIFLVMLSIFLGHILEAHILSAAFVLFPALRKPIFMYINNYTLLSYAAAFHSGAADYIINRLEGTTVCRHVNIFRAILLAKKHNISTFYILTDFNHLRTYVNGTLIDYTLPSYKMDPLLIEKCVIHKMPDVYSVSCYPIYIKFNISTYLPPSVVYDEDELQVINKLLSQPQAKK